MIIGRNLARWFILLSLFIHSYAVAVVYGSDAVVAVLPTVTFPAIDNDNTMLGFGWFNNGFTLEDSTTTCTFNSVYPVAGSIVLNGGILCLQQDFIVSNTATFMSAGTILGNDHKVQLCATVTSLDATYTLKDLVLGVGADIDITGTLVFEGNCYITGNMYHLEFDHGGSLVVAPHSKLIFDNVDLDGLYGKSIACVDDSAQIVFHDTELRFIDDFVFDTGSIEFSERVDFMGSHTFWYDSSQTSTINSGARWTITDDLMLKTGRKNAVNYVEPFYFVDDTSTIKLDHCSLLITGSGIGLSTGKFEMDRDVFVDILSSSTSNGLIIGTGVPSGDFSMELNPGAVVRLLAGWWVYNNTQATGKLNALSESSHCTRYADSQFCVQKNWTIPPMVFQIASQMPLSIIEPGVTFRYDNTKLVLPGGEFDITGQELAPGFLLSGGDDLFIDKGNEPASIYVRGAGNALHGSGNITAPITLQDHDAELNCQLYGVVREDITMNGGTLVLDSDLELGLEAVLTGSGKVDLSTQDFNFSNNGGTWTSSLLWQGNTGIINLKADTSLVGTWTISGNCVIYGNENALDLSGGGQIVVADNAHLSIQHTSLKGISGQSIQLLGNTSSLELSSVIWDQVGSFTLSTGSILFSEGNILEGAYSFIYDSPCTSTIDSHARLAFAEDLTFQIGRKESITSPEPLHFVDETSILQLNNCTFVVTSSGMQLTNGKIEINGDAHLDMLATDSHGGLEMGNGLDGSDILYQYAAGGSLQLRQGWLIYNCYSPYSFIASAEGATVIRYAGTSLLLKKPMIFPRMQLRIQPGGTTTILDGGILTYDNTTLLLDGVTFETTGELVGSQQFRLDGNQSLYLTKGVFPTYLYINGTGNTLYGTGDISGPIIFQNAASQLTCSLIGTLFYGPFLNGGKIILSNDLQLGPDVIMTTSGQVDLGFYRMVLSTKKSTWSSDIAWDGTGGAVSFRADVDLSSTWSFSDECVIDGQGYVLTLNPGGNLVVQPNSVLTIKNTIITGVAGSNIRCVDDTARIVFDNVSWEQSDHALFAAGSIQTYNSVDFKGSYSFVYDSLCTSTISQGSTWSMQEGLVLNIGRKNGVSPLVFGSSINSRLYFHDASLLVASEGLQLTGGKIVVDGDMNLDTPSTSSAVGFIVGNGVAGSDLSLVLNSGANIKFRSGWLVYNNYLPDRFFAVSKNSRILRYADSKTYIQRNWTFPPMTLSVASGQPTTVLTGGSELVYNNVDLAFDGAEFSFTGNQYGDSWFALTGNSLLFLSKGVFEPYLTVSGTGNRLYGSGNMISPVVFTDPSAELSCNLNGFIMYDVALGGGKIILENDLYLGADTTLTQTGSINLAGHNCVFGVEDQAWTSTLVWDTGSISLNSHVTLHGTWTFENSCIVNGNGNLLDLDGAGSFVIADGATVSFRNIRVRGISGDQIRCMGTSSTLILDDVTWEQDGDSVFSQGQIQWAHDVKMKGNSIFAYQSGQVSTILAESRLILDQGFTFSYDPTASASQDLIACVDNTSLLVLNGATLHATVTGMVMHGGWLQIKGDAYLQSETVVDEETGTVLIDEGIALGDGLGDDMVCEIVNGATMNIDNGSLIYNNLGDNTFIPDNRISRLFMHAGTTLWVNETLNLDIGCLYMSNQARVEIVPGKELLGSVFTTA